ncbi:hypothetical protein IQ07DRAFT_16726 [Pyrenochaeta sp. DS3sAY3a]|nr:hypothetical protein IQ07DRAFT_16726 [Pyrenochaeta sp. DS3sAY3a]
MYIFGLRIASVVVSNNFALSCRRPLQPLNHWALWDHQPLLVSSVARADAPRALTGLMHLSRIGQKNGLVEEPSPSSHV